MYDVEGSIAGIDSLETRELPIVHEMGSTIFSERYSASIRRQTSGAIAQSTTWDVFLIDLPAIPYRIQNVTFVSNVAGRISNASLMARNTVNDRETPLKIWDSNEENVTARFREDGGAAANINFLVSSIKLEWFPLTVPGSGQPVSFDELAFRGETTAFGAGTVFCTALVYITFAQIGGISSRGLPLPGW